MLFLKKGAKNEAHNGNNDSIPQPKSNLPKIINKNDLKYTPAVKINYPIIIIALIIINNIFTYNISHN